VEHGVSVDEAVTVFGDPLGRVIEDPHHSQSEERLILLGHSVRRRLLVVMFTARAKGLCRDRRV